MKISIIIPAYNAEKYIGRCVNCCLAQSYKDLEILIVNDGSTDHTSSVLRMLQINNPSIMILDKENGGATSARKEGLKHVTGEFVYFLDADDIIDYNAVELLSKYTAEYDMIISDFLVESENMKPFPLQHKNSIKYGKGKIATYCNFLSKSITGSLSGRLIRTSIFEDFATPLEITIGDDVITNLLIVKKYNPRIKIVNEPSYHYIQHSNSTVNTRNKKSLMKRIEYANWVFQFFKSEDLLDDDNIIRELSYLLLDEYYSFLRDGGKIEYCSSFSILINSEFWSDKVLSEFPIWKRLVLKSYHYNEYLGIFVRNALNILRKLLK